MTKREVRHFFHLIGLLGEWLQELQERQEKARQQIEAASAYDRSIPLRRG